MACIYSPLIQSLRRVSNDFIYVTDILPTLAAAANISIDRSIDGLNQWETISEGSASPRQELIYNIEDAVGYSAIVRDGWKLLNGTENLDNSGWLGDSGRNSINVSLESYVEGISQSEASKNLPQLSMEVVEVLRSDATVNCEAKNYDVTCEPLIKPCLFNIIEDPCELNNLAASSPLKVDFMLSRLAIHIDELVPTVRRLTDPNCDPKYFNNTWTWWQDDVADVAEHWLIYLASILCVILVTFSLVFFLKCKRNKRKINL